MTLSLRHKAPSAKTCIKTFSIPHPVVGVLEVRKHRAPQISHVIPFFQLCTNSQKSQNFNDPTSNIKTTGRELRATFLRYHPRPAPNGALRLDRLHEFDVKRVPGQKAPSAKRCIKTGHACSLMTLKVTCQKAPSAKRCITTGRRPPPCASTIHVRKRQAS